MSATPKCPSFPRKRAIGATFLIRVPLPTKFSAEYDLSNRPTSTPMLLKPEEEIPLSKPSKTSHSQPPGVPYVKPQLIADTFNFPKRNPKKQKPAARENSTKKRTPPKDLAPKRTPLTPEAKKERDRRRSREKRSTAKAMGLCRDCPQPAIDGLTRCEKHQADLLAYSRSRRAAANQSENSPSPKPPARTPQNGANPQTAKPTDQPRP